MSNQITKLTQLDKHMNSFLQLNFNKGFKYIDKTGEIMNLYTNQKVVFSSVGLSGLEIQNPIDGIDQLKVNTNQIWARFINPATVQFTIDNFISQAKQILQIINVDSCENFSWRNQFIYDYKNTEEQNKIEQKFLVLSKGKFSSYESVFEYKNDGIITNLIVQAVEKRKGDKTINSLLIDYDILFTTKFEFLKNNGKLSKLFTKHLLSPDYFLQITNNIIE